MSTLDGLDFEILNILLEDSRTPYLEVARKCNVSGGTVHLRIKKMEDSGLIKGSKLIIDSSLCNYTICAFIMLDFKKPFNLTVTLNSLKSMNEITELHHITGKNSFLLKVICKNLHELELFLKNKLLTLNEIQTYESFISLNQLIDRNIDLKT